MFEMKDDYLTGIDFVDKEHRKLFEIANDAYNALKDDYVADKFDQIVGIIQELKEYTASHFAHEEAYMEKIGYKKRFSHKIEHQEFIDKLNEINLLEVDEDQTGTLVELVDFLGNWLINHILVNDKRIDHI